mmetsp:Transcript_32832/g.75065  ORF Transcript_32832/g.75065 Transcript_32832/m.75065 type:complete len:213 (+) Transcript_32832:94-732(+)
MQVSLPGTSSIDSRVRTPDGSESLSGSTFDPYVSPAGVALEHHTPKGSFPDTEVEDAGECPTVIRNDASLMFQLQAGAQAADAEVATIQDRLDQFPLDASGFGPDGSVWNKRFSGQTGKKIVPCLLVDTQPEDSPEPVDNSLPLPLTTPSNWSDSEEEEDQNFEMPHPRGFFFRCFCCVNRNTRKVRPKEPKRVDTAASLSGPQFLPQNRVT